MASSPPEDTTEQLLDRLRTAMNTQDQRQFQQSVQAVMRDASGQPGAVQAMMTYLDSLRPTHPLESEGWRYMDPPAKFSPEMWEHFLETIGEGNYQILAMSSGKGADGQPFKRGQLMVSPAGQQRIKDAARAPEGVAQ